jgi:hypothetical protein
MTVPIVYYVVNSRKHAPPPREHVHEAANIAQI